MRQRADAPTEGCDALFSTVVSAMSNVWRMRKTIRIFLRLVKRIRYWETKGDAKKIREVAAAQVFVCTYNTAKILEKFPPSLYT